MLGGGPIEQNICRFFIDGVWSETSPEEATPQWLNACDNFASAIRTGAALVCSGREGRRTQAILDAMYRSAFGTRDWVKVEAEL